MRIGLKFCKLIAINVVGRMPLALAGLIFSLTSLAEIRTPDFDSRTPRKPHPLVDPEVYHQRLKSGPVLLSHEQEALLARIPYKDLIRDPLHRVSAEFRVPEGFEKRVQFWFDVYAQYGRDDYVLHHNLFPWIVFDVVRTKDQIKSGKGPLWLRRTRAKKQAHKRKIEIQRALKVLSQKKSFRSLNGLEKRLYEVLAEVPGPRKKVLREAAYRVRTQLGQRDFFKEGLTRSTQYLDAMESVFKKQGLPTELTRLPFVESSFNYKAHSKVGASGIWQIMPRTGKAYMRVNEYIDERRSPIKSTTAAGQILKRYHRALKRWDLAITAYNHGIGNIFRSLRQTKMKDLVAIIEKRQYRSRTFGFASSNFYASFLAALHAEKYKDRLFPWTRYQPKKQFEVTKLIKPTRPSRFLKLANLSRRTFAEYNPDLLRALKADKALPSGLIIHLPPGAAVDRLVELERVRLAKGQSKPSKVM